MNPRPPIILRQRRDFGQTISDSFAFMRQNWKPLLKAMVTIGFLPILLALVFLGVMAFSAFAAVAAGNEAAVLGGIVGVLCVIAAVILMVFAAVMVEAISHEYLRAYERGEHVVLTTAELWRRCLSQFWSYFGIVFINGIATTIGSYLCFLPGIWIGAAFSLARMAHAEERLGAIDSLGRSFKLVHKNFWTTLGIQIVMGIIVAFVAMALFLPFYFAAIVSFVTGMQDMTSGGGPPVVAIIIGSIGGVLLILASFLLIPLLRVCMGLWYYSMVEQTEGKGLQDRLNVLDPQ